MNRVHGRKNGHNSGKSIIQEEAKGRWLLWKENRNKIDLDKYTDKRLIP